MTGNSAKKWEVLAKNRPQGIIDLLLTNRGVKGPAEKSEFLNPKPPLELTIRELGIDKDALELSLKRIDSAIKSGEGIVIYGDYDADGVCATGILWETLYRLGKNVKPYIPDRFSEGYGINPLSIQKIKDENPNVGLIITVDNGIVAYEAVEKATKLGIDVIVTDHHQKDDKLPGAYSVIHTNKLSGSGVAWIIARQIVKEFKNRLTPTDYQLPMAQLELAAIGTIADQLPLVKANRSIAKYGLGGMLGTERVGLKELFRESSISDGMKRPRDIGAYEINYLIAPRINATGRLGHAIDSLRLICTGDRKKASELADHIGAINRRRQEIVDNALKEARASAQKQEGDCPIVVSGNYHEGVIGLVAGKLVEEFGRPVIVISLGKDVSKASARSIPGFDIIGEIRRLKSWLVAAGGHPAAAGLTIRNKNIGDFTREFQKNSRKLLTAEMLTKVLKIDCVLEFDMISADLVRELQSLKPFGIGNPQPTFLTEKTEVVGLKIVGGGMNHLKLELRKENRVLDAIGFGIALTHPVKIDDKIDIVYSVEENYWNGSSSLQLKIKDLKLSV